MEGFNTSRRASFNFILINNKSLIEIFSDSILHDYDTLGTPFDLDLFDDFPECGIYESIKSIETTKHTIKHEYLKHLTIVSLVLDCKITALVSLKFCLENDNNDDLFWCRKIQAFYKSIISNIVIFENLEKYGIKLEHIEKVLDMIQQIEKYNLDNYEISPDNSN